MDLGQSSDPSALALVDRNDHPEEPPDLVGPRYPHRGRLRVLALKRWPLGTDYAEVANDVLAISPPWDVLVVDYCGVGRAVVDLGIKPEAVKRQHGGKIVPVVTVASNARARVKSGPQGESVSVPKIELVSSILIAQQSGKLVLPAIPETQMLLQELGDYRMRYSAAANLEFGNAPGKGKHDDLISALGLCLHAALRFQVRRPAFFMG